MKPKKRQKMCYNCEGEVDLDVIVCPFCAADLRDDGPDQTMGKSYASADLLQRGEIHGETSHSLYPSSSFTKEEMQEEIFSEEKTFVSEQAPQKRFSSQASRFICPTILFTLGVQLFVLGMFILLFSHKGIVVLKWDGTLWFLYVLAACPLLFGGYHFLSKLDNEEKD